VRMDQTWSPSGGATLKVMPIYPKKNRVGDLILKPHTFMELIKCERSHSGAEEGLPHSLVPFKGTAVGQLGSVVKCDHCAYCLIT
jgi:hypothetical protein